MWYDVRNVRAGSPDEPHGVGAAVSSSALRSNRSARDGAPVAVGQQVQVLMRGTVRAGYATRRGGNLAGGSKSRGFWLELHEQLNSVPAMFLVLACVFLGLVLTLLPSLSSSTSEELAPYDLALSVLFLVELTARVAAHARAEPTLLSFFKDPYAVVDTVVVTFDVLLFVLTSVGIGMGNSSESKGWARGLRAIRLVRLVRLLRAGRAIAVLRKAIAVAPRYYDVQVRASHVEGRASDGKAHTGVTARARARG